MASESAESAAAALCGLGSRPVLPLPVHASPSLEGRSGNGLESMNEPLLASMSSRSSFLTESRNTLGSFGGPSSSSMVWKVRSKEKSRLGTNEASALEKVSSAALLTELIRGLVGWPDDDARFAGFSETLRRENRPENRLVLTSDWVRETWGRVLGT